MLYRIEKLTAIADEWMPVEDHFTDKFCIWVCAQLESMSDSKYRVVEIRETVIYPAPQKEGYE